MNTIELKHINDLSDEFSASIDGGYAEPSDSQEIDQKAPYLSFCFVPENLIMPVSNDSSYAEGSFSFTFRVGNYDSSIETLEFSAYYEPVENEPFESELQSFQFNQTYNVDKDISDVDLKTMTGLYQLFLSDLEKVRKALNV